MKGATGFFLIFRQLQESWTGSSTRSAHVRLNLTLSAFPLCLCCFFTALPARSQIVAGPNNNGNLTIIYGAARPVETKIAPEVIARFSPWRISGTNLVDFSPVIPLALVRDPMESAAKYLVEGIVIRVYRTNFVLIESDIGGHWMQDPSGYAETFSPRPGYSPPVAHHYVPTGLKWVEEHADCLLTNAPLAIAKPNAQVQLFAWPCRQIEWPDSKRNPRSVLLFDYGRLERISPRDYPVYLRVTTNGAVTTKLPQPSAR